MVTSVPRLMTHGLTKTFAGKEVVSDLSFSATAGQVVCLLGPSGCGKSTTLKIVAGIERQDSGTVRIDGNIVSGSGRHLPPEQRSVGLLFQEFALFPHLTVAENVAFGISSKGRSKRRQVEELLGKVKLKETRDRYPHELSGGEQQRIALARALAAKPRIMLMDEPFSNLDNRLRDDVRDEMLVLLKDEGTAVVLVTHEPAEAMRTGDQIELMRAGRIIQSGRPYDVYNSPIDRKAAEFFSEINVVHGVVRGSIADSPFGRFPAPGLVDGADVEIMIRPQHLRIDFDRNGSGPVPTDRDGTAARGIVEKARYMGNASLVEFRMEHDNSVIKATVPSVFLPRPGTPMWLSIRRDKFFLFPCIVQSRVGCPFVSGQPASGKLDAPVVSDVHEA